MVSKHGFDRQQLQEILSQSKRLDYVLRLMDRQAPTTQPPAGPNGAWLRYRKQFITPDNVQNGVAFWNQYEDALNRAWQVYGVPPEIIVGIIGVETRWGRIMGKHGFWTRWRRCHLTIRAGRNISPASWKPSCSWRAMSKTIRSI